MPFDDGKQPLGKPQFPADRNANQGMMEVMGARPADIVKKSAETDQLPVNTDLLHLPGKGDSGPGNSPAMGNHRGGAPRIYQDIFFKH